MSGHWLHTDIARRDLLKGAGGLIVGFALARRGFAQAAGQPSLGPYGPPTEELDSWIAIAKDGTATLYSGCCELGTGSSTGLLQIMAEELDIPFEHAKFFGPDTSRTPDQFVSSGSRTISVHGRPIRQAAAEARHVLLELAAQHLGVPVDRLTTADGVVSVRGEPERSIAYGALIGGRQFNLKITGEVQPKDPEHYRIVGTSVPRVDIPAKVFGTFNFVQDVKVPGMVHGRVVRPSAHGARVLEVNTRSVAQVPGLIAVVRERDFVGVVCEREEQAIAAAAGLQVTWSEWAELPDMADLYDALRSAPEYPAGYSSQPNRPPVPNGIVTDEGNVDEGLAAAATVIEATYLSPYHHHGSIGPSCAVADVRGGRATVWSGTQTPYGLRDAVAKFLGLENNDVRLIYVEASGCYGQNGADDVVIDAIILSRGVERPVRVQWMRAEENGWETYKSARVADCRGGIDRRGRIMAWETRARGYSAYSRPQYHEPAHGGEPGSLVSAQLAGWSEPGLEEGFGGATVNIDPIYQDIPNQFTQLNYLGPSSHREGSTRIRTGSVRGVGSPDNVFVAESFMDELAVAAGADALEFRLRHEPTERMVAVLRAAAEGADWQARPPYRRPPSRDETALGRGIAAVGGAADTNVAGVLEVAVNRRTGEVRVRRAVIAQDCGLVVNPDAVTDQVEGGVIQALSRALKEEVTFDNSRVTSLDWAAYPIITFPEIPEAIEVILLDRLNDPPRRVGEPAGEVVWPALANAIYDATGVRLRQLPFTPQRILQGLAAL